MKPRRTLSELLDAIDHRLEQSPLEALLHRPQEILTTRCRPESWEAVEPILDPPYWEEAREEVS